MRRLFPERRHLASSVRNFSGAIIDLAVLAAALVFAYSLRDLDLFDALVAYLHEHEDHEYDELLLVAAVGLVGLTTFAMRRMLDQKREVRARRVAEERARQLAMADTLTGLPNRRQFQEKFDERLASLAEDRRSFALMMLDLDRFKLVNDVFGHGAGDKVLIAFARRASALIGPTGFLARLGGDEYAILLGPLADAEEPSRVARRIVSLFEEAFEAGGERVTLGVSIGIALAPQDGVDAEELTRRADIALYRAKAGGRGNFCFFEPEMDAHVKKRGRLERDLRLAMKAEEIRAFYQPIVDLKTGEVVGFEAQARWQHPEFGAIPTEQFIGIAEDSGLITQLSSYLLRQASRDAMDWPQDIKLSFNLSAMQLADPLLCLRVLQILGDTGLSPRRLELEISEAAMVADVAAAKRAIAAFHQAGVRIALDEFGKGNSSLAHLRECRFDRIKIDGSFIHAMPGSSDNAGIVRAIIGLSRALGLQVTAGGIETSAVIGPLIAEGCSEGQGFPFPAALPAADAAALLAGKAELRRAT